LNESTLLKHHY